MQAEYKEFLALGHGDIFDLDITRCVAVGPREDIRPAPWTLPGSDLSDYFNYNLDPESWRYYCAIIDAYRCAAAISNLVRKLAAVSVAPGGCGQDRPSTRIRRVSSLGGALCSLYGSLMRSL